MRLLAGCVFFLCQLGPPVGVARGEATVFPGERWREATPQSQYVDPVRLKAALDYMTGHFGPDGANELVIVRNGYLIWAGPNADAYHPIFSCTKTFTSAVLGLLVNDGKCTLDELAVKYLPGLDSQYPVYGKIKLRHLASMCGGYQGEVKLVREDQPWGDPMAFLNPRPPLFEAGSTVQYNDHEVFLLGKILTLLAHEPLRDVFQRRIAGPIGMRKWDWGVSGTVDGIPLCNPPGNPGGAGAGGVKFTPRELARFGLLMLNRGRWSGKQLLSAAFVDAATSNQIPVTARFRNHDFRGRYGFYWWVNGVMANGKRSWPSAPPKTYAAHGAGCNFCFVIPEWDMVVVRMGTTPIAPGKIARSDELLDGFLARLAEALPRPAEVVARDNGQTDLKSAPVAKTDLTSVLLEAKTLDAEPYLRYVHPTVREPFTDGVSLAVPAELGDPRTAALGLVDVTKAPFHADPTGARDATGALQRAINFARDHQMVCFFPPGTYRISDTLECVEQLYRRANGRVFGAPLWPCTRMGSRAGSARPKLLLAPNSPGFGS